jgi:O-antigen/teichoic acid export membrane protein
MSSYILGGRYDYTLFRADKPVRTDVDLVIVASFIFSIFFIALLTILGAIFFFIASICEFKLELPNWVFLAPISIFTSVAWIVTQSVLNFQGNYKFLAIVRIFISFLSSVLIILFAFSGVSGGIIIGGLLAQFIVVVLVLFKSYNFNALVNLKDVKLFLFEFKEHPIKLAPTWVLNIFAQQAPILFLGLIFSPTTVGLYSIASKASYAPVHLISNAAGDIFRRLTVRKIENNQLRADFISIFLFFLIIGIPIYITIFFIGAPMLDYILGSKWHGLSEFLNLMLVLGYFQFCFTPLDKVALAFGKSTYLLIWNSIRLLGVLLIALIVTWIGSSALIFIGLMVCFNCLLYIVDFLYGYFVISSKLKLKD